MWVEEELKGNKDWENEATDDITEQLAQPGRKPVSSLDFQARSQKKCPRYLRQCGLGFLLLAVKDKYMMSVFPFF